MLTHLNLPLQEEHFNRWLSLFEETAMEVMSPQHAQVILNKAHHIAQNFRMAIAYHRGQVINPLPS